MADTEEALPGGWISEVVRVGDTVRRIPAADTDDSYVERLLRFLDEAGFDAAPRFLGRDTRGRQVLSYVDGQARSGAVPDSIGAVMRTVRRLHDLTAGTEFAATADVVCHNDLSPRNTIYRNGQPVALIDWDLAAPGRRIEDVAHACWQYLPMGGGAPPADTGAWMRAACDAYGLQAGERGLLIEEIVAWQERSASGIETRAAAGHGPWQHLVEIGAPAQIRAVRDWVLRHRRVLSAALASDEP